MSTRSIVVMMMLGAALLILGSALRAGPLNPPAGPVAPTPGPEPRVAVNATNTPGDSASLFVISQPGSYYLTGNITGVVGKHGIRILSHGVTLDLNGFDLAGVAGMGAFDGVTTFGASTLRNICVRNGSLRDWGGDGIDLGGLNHQIERIRVSTCLGNGISVGSSATVTDCSALSNSGHGIVTGGSCAVRHCSATLNAMDGIFVNVTSSVSGCEAIDNSRNGITAFTDSAVSECTASSNGRFGIELTFDGVVDRCRVKSNGFDGIRVQNGCRVTENLCVNNGNEGLYSGIFANGNNNRIEGNHVTTVSTNDGGISIAATGTGNLVIRNYSQGSGALNYTHPPMGNFIGTIAPGSNPMNMAENANLNISY